MSTLYTGDRDLCTSELCCTTVLNTFLYTFTKTQRMVTVSPLILLNKSNSLMTRNTCRNFFLTSYYYPVSLCDRLSLP